jgi:hypothetical protein
VPKTTDPRPPSPPEDVTRYRHSGR